MFTVHHGGLLTTREFYWINASLNVLAHSRTLSKGEFTYFKRHSELAHRFHTNYRTRVKVSGVKTHVLWWDTVVFVCSLTLVINILNNAFPADYHYYYYASFSSQRCPSWQKTNRQGDIRRTSRASCGWRWMLDPPQRDMSPSSRCQRRWGVCWMLGGIRGLQGALLTWANVNHWGP